jgi:serine protease Do
VTVQGLTSDLASGLGLTDVKGALVSDVERGGPAAAAGLQRGDVITAINGEAVADSNALRNRIAEFAPGTEVTLKVLRSGKEQTVTAKLGSLEASNADRSSGGAPQESGRFGLSVEPLTPELARQRGVSATSGVLVAEVVPGSRAADAGLRSGDVIEQVDRKPVTSVEELRSALSAGDKPAVLLVHRGATTVFVTIAR